ncbi:DUF3634 family protein [Photobacterium galatheae]|uniref:DUF3634 domain-containing protein n=1 Tax=Photobacterium galatheae TaxID=1654360 RepID=A0A066RM49_9GAMM|nr:DUF3634 family protein [Photobacterium galatheae]KDM91434.1 hypothetical protein EA58_10415 [Photobacterium galatheae]MCM0149506.1 DUF3634 family protein [Photobacterium galatheae]
MEYVFLLAIAVLILVFKDRPVMVLIFEDGKLIKTKGHIPAGFLNSCKDIAHRAPFNGQIKVYKNRFTTKLIFSKDVPVNVKQKIRNVFPFASASKKAGHKRA